jgi:hypothetical protein
MKNLTDPILYQSIMLPLVVAETAKSIIDFHENNKRQIAISKAKAEWQNEELKQLCEIYESRVVK